MQKQISDILNDSFNNIQKVINDKGLITEIEIVATKIIQAFKDGNKLLPVSYTHLTLPTILRV